LIFAAIAACTDDATAPATEFYANLTGDAAGTDSPGSGVAEFRIVGTAIMFDLSVSNLSGPPTLAHVHMGGEGETGLPILNVCGTGDGTPACPANNASLTGGTTALVAGQTLDAVVAAMRTSGAYADVHTEMHPGGEIRGQVVGVY
jgi:hypothetical protein